MLEELTSNGSTWPSVGLDLVGAFPIRLGKKQHLIVDHSTKWIVIMAPRFMPWNSSRLERFLCNPGGLLL